MADGKPAFIVEVVGEHLLPFTEEELPSTALAEIVGRKVAPVVKAQVCMNTCTVRHICSGWAGSDAL